MENSRKYEISSLKGRIREIRTQILEIQGVKSPMEDKPLETESERVSEYEGEVGSERPSLTLSELDGMKGNLMKLEKKLDNYLK